MRLQSKRYLRMQIALQSSMSIGSGENEHTDHDILVDAHGNPYIPGTAVAGVTRHALAESNMLRASDIEKVFGRVIINDREGTNSDIEYARGSRIVTYDVRLTAAQKDGRPVITNRDMVKLDECKTAEEGAKFDMEVLEPGVVGTVLIEENRPVPDEEEAPYVGQDQDPLRMIAELWNAGVIRFGAKTTRGYGAIGVTRIQKAEFNLQEKDGVTSWLDFDPLATGDDGWEEWTVNEITGGEICLTLGLRPVGGLSIRRYVTNYKNTSADKLDYEQMTYADGNPVIPGTTWAGAFRHAVKGYLKDEDAVRKVFGDVYKGTKTRSDIYFSESKVEGKDRSTKVLTRVAVDRLTGAAIHGALFTERVAYGGKTELVIRIKENAPGYTERFRNALAASVVDLHEGFLAIGGETSIGRGLFEITTVNGKKAEQNATKLYNQVRSVL